VVFSISDPANIGTFDYHSAHRRYDREKFAAAINVNIQERSIVLRSTHFSIGRTSTPILKTNWPRPTYADLFMKEAGGSDTRTPSILKTMDELFTLFLPGKEFGDQGQARKAN